MRNFWLHALVAVPLSNSTGWKNVQFSHIPPNKVGYSKQGLQIEVDHSSSPLLYAFGKTLSIKAFTAEIEIQGELKSPNHAWPEDSYLRMGFVMPGDRHMSGLEKLFAAEWVKQLFELAPKDSGIQKIIFYNLTANGDFVGKNRVMPKSKDLMQEFIVQERKSETKTFSYKMESPLKTVALWLSSDGDDTGSAFKLLIKSLKLETEE